MATYRLQFNPAFTFAQARELVPYLHELGITDCYASPILMACPGSGHGYDICDHGQVNPDLGGQTEFDALAACLQTNGMGLLLDTVPNHMGIRHSRNGWWMDVLENGPSSIYSSYFDIDWHPVNPNLENKVLIPLLEDQYGTVLETGKIRLAYEEGAFFLTYYENRLPLEPASYRVILEPRLPELKTILGENHPHVQELHSILTALSYLPAYTETSPEKIQERSREKEVIKRRIASLAGGCGEFQEAIGVGLKNINGSPEDPASFNQLDRLLETQPYRLAYWRVATEEINYRRFFDINELAAICVELPEVFRATHQLFFQLLAEGKATGLRIDHPDGLWDPTDYFRRLQEGYLSQWVRIRQGAPVAPETLSQEITALMNGEPEASATGGTRPAWPLYVVAEKILGEEEPLPSDWAVAGTTGYDFLNAVNGLFVNGANGEALDKIYTQFIGQPRNFHALVLGCQKMIMLVSMAGELAALGHQLDRISEGNRRYRDFTLNSLTFAVREIIAALPIYRTYINGRADPSPRDRRFIEQAVEQAKEMNPRTAAAIFDFIRDTLLLQNLAHFRAEDQPLLLAWTMKFQQLTGPVLAKGLEDTAFYVFNRLASLNEVGGHPEKFGYSLDEFHRQNQERRQKWPHGMLASTTHDTKRSEDVRARINVLSEIPKEWQAALTRWSQLNAPKKTMVEGRLAPDSNDEYLLYQTLLGAWPAVPLSAETMPAFRERVKNYILKAIKEAKVHTSWINPNQQYDAAMVSFVRGILPDHLDEPFLQDFMPFQRRLGFSGYFNSLSQVLLKMTCPGVPDLYQGSELWDFRLVDPDNRGPVDFTIRRKYLEEIRQRLARGKPLPLARELLTDLSDGKVKLYVIYQTLNFRKKQPELFLQGSYQPLAAEGSKREHLTAFSRAVEGGEVLVVVPRLIAGLTGGKERLPLGARVWHETWIPRATHHGSAYRNIFTGEVIQMKMRDERFGLVIADILRHFPVALLCRE